MNMNIPSQRPLIVVDTDMGYDDIMAIAMLLSAGEPIAGITIVNGLAAVDSGADNMLRLLDRAGLGHIPVAVGAAAPL